MKTKIEIETHQLTIIRVQRSQKLTVFCRFCETEVFHLTVNRAAGAIGVSEMEVFRLVENREVHSIETEAGTLFICSNSLTNLTDILSNGRRKVWEK